MVMRLSMLAVATASPMQEMVDQINSLETTWVAEVPSRFESFEDAKMLMGAKLVGDADYQEFLAPKPEHLAEFEGEIATDFDVRTAFPDCAEVSGFIGDQSSCGSCWAFGSTMAFNDRHCIATGSKAKFSMEDTTANCDLTHCFSMGCNGGHPGAAWLWFRTAGVVTGGDYSLIGKGETCGPYTMGPCAHHVPATEKYPVCPKKEYPTPVLKECSEKSYTKSYSADKTRATNSYSLSGDVEKIQRDVMQHGSATMAFSVYEDFVTYKSGVYKHKTGKMLGGHAVRLIGWGVENGEDYWLIANSWNEMWGNGGTFKIAKGTNECNIEGNVQAGTAGSKVVV